MRRTSGLLLALTLAAACSSDHSSLTTVTSTSTAGTAPSTTTVPCEPGGAGARQSPDPAAMSGRVGAGITVEPTACGERVTIELAGSGTFPGWVVEYVEDPVRLGESEEFVSLAGDATLLVRMGMWMRNTEGQGYDGPTDVLPTHTTTVKELRLTENWEGRTIWAIGLDRQHPFRAQVLHQPERLVIDLITGI